MMNKIILAAAAGLPEGALFVASRGEFSWTPGFDQAGDHLITFAAVEAVPGDPFSKLESPKMTQESIDRYKESWGYGTKYSGWYRFRTYMERLFLHGDLGMSIAQGRPVRTMLADAIPNQTAENPREADEDEEG